MTDTTIEAGRWYRRTRDGLVVRAAWRRTLAENEAATTDGWWARPCAVSGDAYVAVNGADLEPWVPRVGEWVRLAWPGGGRGDGTQVLACDPHGGRVLVRRGACPLDACEPCAPPADATAPPAIEALPPPSPEHLAAWAALGALSAPPPRRDDGTRCHRCGGPAYTGLGVGGPPECLSPRCEPRSELEPTVRERWLTRTEGVFAIPVPGGERVWWATGHGIDEMHPIRDEAVARWKEIVHRKR